MTFFFKNKFVLLFLALIPARYIFTALVCLAIIYGLKVRVASKFEI